MALEKKPFVRYNEKKVDNFAVRLNPEERATLESCKEILEQPKDSTCLKQLAMIGAKTIHQKNITYILTTIYANKRKNKRLGIADY